MLVDAEVFIVVGAVAALGFAAALLFLVRRRQPPPCVQHAHGGWRPRYPVVLVHGMLGFDYVEIGATKHDYFRGVVECLRELGIEVYTPRVAGVAAVAVRAQQLSRQIEMLSAQRVNIIAHSMGGLDARYALARLGLSRRVASLTTIATPHRGTPIADFGTSIFGEKLGLRRMLAAAGVDLGAFYDVTTARTLTFNEDVEDAPGVTYGCVVATVDGRKGGLNPLLWPGYNYLSAFAGANDGMVPAKSQVWGDVLAQVEADHLAQVGWSKHFDAMGFFENLMRELRGRGL
ncbi:MAG: esterase/lipase family protein [Candidatus Binatia bacterium]